MRLEDFTGADKAMFDKNISEADKVKLIIENQEAIQQQAKQNRKELGINEDQEEELQEDQMQEKSLYEYDLDCVEIHKQELLKKFPWAANQIDDAIS